MMHQSNGFLKNTKYKNLKICFLIQWLIFVWISYFCSNYYFIFVSKAWKTLRELCRELAVHEMTTNWNDYHEILQMYLNIKYINAFKYFSKYFKGETSHFISKLITVFLYKNEHLL